MTKHVMALIYEPKIEPVRDGRCTQTIRKGRKVSVGDSILFHGWEGKPYRSKWSWQRRVTVSKAIQILIHDEGISEVRKDWIGPVSHWWGNYCKALAVDDFIEPATGEALRDVLFKFGGAPSAPEKYQIIRW